MEDNMTTIEELNATIEALKAENSSLKAELECLDKANEEAKNEYQKMRGWWAEANTENDRIKGCMKAIATLLNAIK